jgi:hypothetical protein
MAGGVERGGRTAADASKDMRMVPDGPVRVTLHTPGAVKGVVVGTAGVKITEPSVIAPEDQGPWKVPPVTS